MKLVLETAPKETAIAENFSLVWIQTYERFLGPLFSLDEYSWKICLSTAASQDS